jgi:hypothetical protein
MPPTIHGTRRPPLIGPVAEVRAQELRGIVDRYQKARQNRGHGKLHHHHPVHRGRGQYDNRAKCHLHQTKPHDPEPADVHHIPLIAKAETIMPAT